MQIDRTTPIAWFTRETFAVFQTLCADMADDDYDAWLQRANQIIESVEAEGFIVVKVNIDPASLAKWCGPTQRDIKAEDRAAFAVLTHERMGRH